MVYVGSVLLFGAEFLDVLEAVDAEAAIFGHLHRPARNGFDVDDMFEAVRRVVQYRPAFLVRLANHRRHRRCQTTISTQKKKKKKENINDRFVTEGISLSLSLLFYVIDSL